MSLTSGQRNIMLHTLGLSNGRTEQTRNHFLADPHSPELDLLNGLVELGFMKIIPTPSFAHHDDIVYMVTDAGKEAIVSSRVPGCCCPPPGHTGIWAAAMCPVHHGLRARAVPEPAPEVVDPELAGFIKVAKEQGHDCERRSNGDFANIYLNGAWLGWQQRAQYDNPELTVWYGPMPESNGKSNFTAILKRTDAKLWDEDVAITIDRGEYPHRVRYEADRMRYLIGEIDKEPCIMDYDPDEHSGYVKPPAPPTEAEVLLKSLWDDTGLRCLMRPDQVRRISQLLGVECEYDHT